MTLEDLESLAETELPDAFAALDEDDLGPEWRRQPQLALQIGVHLAKARKDMLEAKAMMDEAKASTAQQVRANPEKFRVIKITEGQIDEIVLTQKNFREAHQNYIDAKFKVDLLEAAANAVEHKKKALESLVYGQGQMFFGAPKIRSGESADKLRKQQFQDEVRDHQKKLKNRASD